MASPLSPAAKSAPTTQLSSPSASSSAAAGPSSAGPAPAEDPPPAPVPPPLHLAAQTGDLAQLYSLLDAPAHSSPAALTASDPDPAGITPLHWAAINGHTLFCKALVDRGAQIDARGGDLDATPVMWAARNGHLGVVHLLLQYGADPTLVDSQGFNALHLAVHSSSAFLVAYLVFTLQPLALDAADPEGHTALAWAAYQGDAISVELLLAAGADPARADAAGLTPLHWAVTKGNATCIRRVVSHPRVDLHARNADGKTAREMSIALKSLAAYQRALADAGLDESGAPVDRPLGERNTRRAIFAVVAAALGLALALLAHTPWFVGVLLAAATAFAMHHVVVRVLLGAGTPRGQRKPAHGHGHGHGHHHHGGTGERVTKSPYLCAIICGSLGWVGWVWVTRYATQLHGYYLVPNALFALLFASCCYNFYRAVTLDPGTVRGPERGSEGLKEVIEELVDAGAFNGMNFCLSCLVRRPLRSKHSYATERYCPWVWNDIGVNNHRQFLLFLVSLVLGVLVYIRLTWGYFYEKAPDLPPTASCPSLSPTMLCMSLRYDPFALLVCLWASLQLLWTIILLFAQLYQVARQMTTLEVSNLGRYGYMGGRPGVSGAAQAGAVEKHNAASAAAAAAAQRDGGAGDGQESDDPASLAHAPAPARADSPSSASPRAAKGSFAFVLKLLGLDRFVGPRRARASPTTATAAADASTNPFDLGVVGNCVDFWTSGRELGVRYDELWGIPEGGYRRAVGERKRREREERERNGAGAGGGGWFARGGGGAGAAGGGERPRGYERVAMDEV
ncbi:hypothetical protein Rhopal_007376-T1 [Rhodotorula paludigena]|uniref:Palmitoyltransferase n=1 Tax=Rhodotorula paludigena TaxID=86838 RepID=A0AAV5GY72_9BASI|nr:hypothetical protein Rhopal_007376-T1 [Rhodotorula paludigena]